MSKMDNLRAMREARYEQAQARAAAPGAGNPAAKPAAAKRSAKPAATPAATGDAAPEEPTPAEALCGHRNMSGRTCTREAGHSAKSHRYS